MISNVRTKWISLVCLFCMGLFVFYQLQIYISTHRGIILNNVQDKGAVNNQIKLKEQLARELWEQTYSDPNNDTVVIPALNVLRTMSRDRLADIYHQYINSLQVFCRKVLHLGQLTDGGWDICDDVKYRPPLNKCLVYSFGINNDFSFDDAIVKRYGCLVHAFDPSMKQRDHKHGKNVYFHNLGISDNNVTIVMKNKPWKMATLQTIRNRLKHNNTKLDILKIDIEDWEWRVLPELIKSGSIKDVTQFVIEIHIERGNVEPGVKQYLFALSVLKDVYDAGFRIFWTHRNLWCKFFSAGRAHERSGCHEVSFININS